MGIINSIDIGGLIDGISGGTGDSLNLYSNNGFSILYKAMLGFSDNCHPSCYIQYFYSQNTLQSSINLPYSLPLSLTLQNGKIYGMVGYNNTLENYNSTTQTFSDDRFAIRSGTKTTVQWIRIRKPPPNDILPIANTIN